MSWKEHLNQKSSYYRKKKENRDASSSDLSKGIVYVPRTMVEPGTIFKFFLVPHIKKNIISMTRGLHWMHKGKPSVRCPIFSREDQEYVPNPEENENVLDAIQRAIRKPDGPRCAWCELHLAAYIMDNSAIQESTFGDNYKDNRGVSLRVDFFVLPYNKIYETLPECFGDKPDFNDPTCKECIWSGECYLNTFAVNILEKTQGVEQQIIRSIESVMDEVEEDDDILDLENAVLFKLETIDGKRIEYDVQAGQRYNIVKQFEKATGKDIYEVLEENWPEDKLFFQPSHTYLEMMTDMKPAERKLLERYLAEEGLEIPGMDDDAREKLSVDNEEDDEDEERPRRRKRRSEDDDEDIDEKPQRRRRPVSDDEDEEEVTETRTMRFRRRK